MRLGHPSDKVVKSLHVVSSTDSATNKTCDICHQVKQNRDKFSISDYKTTKFFELIHCDL